MEKGYFAGCFISFISKEKYTCTGTIDETTITFDQSTVSSKKSIGILK